MISFSIYIILAVFVYGMIFFLEPEKNHEYRVESNRIIATLQEGKEINLEDYSSISEITFLDIKESDERKIQEFFLEKNEQKSFIQPYLKNGILRGYLCFYYTEPINSNLAIFFILELILFVTWFIVFLILLYLKHKIIQPFYRFSSLPQALAKGHYKGEVKLEKSKYFKQFLLGMSQLKDELELSKKRQMELLKQKKQLLLSLSHDIKTPLNLIKLYEKSLEENVYSNEQEKIEALKQISKKTIEIEEYVEQITTSFREEIMDLPVTITEFYLDNVLDNVSQIYEEKCKLQHIRFIVEEHGNPLIKADKDRLQEVLENILENAIKYGDGKEISITFSEQDYCHLIHIYNTGNPVSEHELVHLFDSFFRGMNTSGKQGSGLGLYIAKQLMRKMNGDIYAENKENGMRYTMVLP